MIKTIVRSRRSGKTTEVITRLRENENLVVLVPWNEMKKHSYPKDVHDRVFTFEQLDSGLRGKRLNKILIDEGFLMSKDAIAKFYYDLGRLGTDVEVYGTIEKEV